MNNINSMQSYDDWSNAYALILKGNALSNLGKYEEAIKCYDRIFGDKFK